MRGDADLDCRADIYALGATLYQVVTGKMLFEGSAETEIIDLQETERVPDPIDLNPKVSKAMCWLLEKMLAKDRAYRHQDWEAVRQDIKRVKKGMLPAGKKLPDGAGGRRIVLEDRGPHPRPVRFLRVLRDPAAVQPNEKVTILLGRGDDRAPVHPRRGDQCHGRTGPIVEQHRDGTGIVKNKQRGTATGSDPFRVQWIAAMLHDFPGIGVRRIALDVPLTGEPVQKPCSVGELDNPFHTLVGVP